jgi:hypothetical protein
MRMEGEQEENGRGVIAPNSEQNRQRMSAAGLV